MLRDMRMGRDGSVLSGELRAREAHTIDDDVDDEPAYTPEVEALRARVRAGYVLLASEINALQEAWVERHGKGAGQIAGAWSA